MIRQTLDRTKRATFSVLLPDGGNKGMPTATGTGFFVSPDGWFMTAAHVITEDGKVRDDISSSWLMKETRIAGGAPGAMCQFVSFEHILPELDVAFLKVDFEKNSDKAWLKDASEFPFVQVSRRELEEGESVYAFGYPLPETRVQSTERAMIGSTSLSPRVTSAIVSSTFEKGRMIITGGDPAVYVLDKALNYGNSGGPILSVETGHVHALCSRFQPVFVPQPYLQDSEGNQLPIMIPSLYGIVSGLHHQRLLELLDAIGVPVVET